MAFEGNRVCEIPVNDWPALRDKFLVDWPRNLTGYCTVDNFIRWHQHQPDIKNLHLYCLNDDWSDGTYVAIDRYQLFINSLNPLNDRLTQLLSLLDWSHGFKVSTFMEKNRSAVVDVVKSKLLSAEYDSQTLLYYLPKEDGLNLKIEPPDGITLGTLSESDAEKADAVWPNKHVGSTFFLKRLSKWNPNVGAFNENGELIAWSFRLQAGPIGAMQVDEKHMNRGLGTLVCAAITKKISELGHDCCACVGKDNPASCAVFSKLGYKVVDNAYWLRTYPTVPFKWTDDDL